VLTLERVDRRVEFLGGQGLICRDDDGARATHLHGSVADETGRVLGGHFERGLNPVYNNMDFTLHELSGVDLVRRWDPQTETVEMVVAQGEESA
jgi:predicted DNA-binding protein with PD1-like motif